MRQAPVLLTEYQPSAPTQLTVGERDTLRALVPDLTVEPVAGSTDTYYLRGRSSVGVVRVGELTVELRPKVGIAPVLFLLSYALDPGGWREPPAALVRDPNLAEAVVPLFARAAGAALRPGLLHGYRRHEDTLTTVRGRVRMVEQMRARTGLPLPVEVVYDDFTPNIVENQILLTAVDTLGRLRLRHSGSRRSLARLRQQLEAVTPVSLDGRGVPDPHWTRLNARYRPAVSLARLIVTTVGLEARAGGEDASSFVVDMNAVFERFVRVALREALHLPSTAFPAGSAATRIHLDTSHYIPLEPDLSWWDNGTCVFVGDCKYKKTTTSTPNADVYQMLAYLTALDLSEGLLIYAAGEDVQQEIMIKTANKRIHVRTLDITQPPDIILQDVAQIATLVSRLRANAVLRTSQDLVLEGTSAGEPTDKAPCR